MSNLLSPTRQTLFYGFLILILMGFGLFQTSHSADLSPETINNSAKPTNGIVKVELQEKWRTGGPDSQLIFGFISRILADGDDRVYVLDRQLSNVQAFTPQGHHLGQISREGEGPGETRTPGDLLITDQGNLGLVQGFPGKLVKINRDNVPQGNLHIAKDPAAGGYMIMAFGMCQNSNLVLGGIDVTEKMGVDRRVQYVGSYDADGRELVRYTSKPRKFISNRMMLDETENYFLDREHFALDNKGRLFAATERNQYAITVYDQQGQVDRVIKRKFASRQRTDDELASIRDDYEYQISFYRNNPQYRVAETEPDIKSLHVDHDGQLWVYHSFSDQNLPNNTVMKVDVFDTHGNYINEAHLIGPGDANSDGWFFLGNNYVVRVVGHQAAYQAIHRPDRQSSAEQATDLELICYQMIRK